MPPWRQTSVAPRLGLAHPLADLVQRQQVGVAAQVERERTLGEGAEPALEGADVGVVDVAVDDEGDVVADEVAAHAVRELDDGVEVGAAGVKERGQLLAVELVARA
jgi:hypothetical protein